MLYQSANSTPQSPANIGGNPSSPPPLPVTPQPIPPANPRFIELRNKKVVPMPSPARLKSLEDKKKALNKSNNARHKTKFAESGSMSN